MEWGFFFVGIIFVGLGFLIKAFPYFGSYAIDDLFNLDIERFSTAMGYLLIILGAIIAVVATICQWLEWYIVVKYIMFGCIVTMIVGVFVFHIAFTIKKK